MEIEELRDLPVVVELLTKRDSSIGYLQANGRVGRIRFEWPNIEAAREAVARLNPRFLERAQVRYWR